MPNNYSYKVIDQDKEDDSNLLDLEDIKNYVRITADKDDNLIKLLLSSAIEIAENFTGLSLRTKTIEVEIFDSNRVRLPFMPLIEITEINVDDEELEEEEEEIIGDIVTLGGYSTCKKLNIKYKAGYEDSSIIPAPIIHGIMLHIASMYDSRGSDMMPPVIVLQMYQPYRRMNI